MKENMRCLKMLVLAALLSVGVHRATADPLPPIKTVFIILMENFPWSAIERSTNAPYMNSVVLPQAAYCEQYYNASNFTCSLPTYLWLEGGTDYGTWGSANCDGPPSLNHQSTTNHLVSQLERAGIPWKAYQEGISGTNVPLTDLWPYAVRHDPFVYFDDLTGTNNPNYAYGIAHIRPYTELENDLINNTVARYNFITPNICSDMHDSCSPLHNQVLQGDTWLSQELPKILASSAYSNNGVIFITWDDGGVAGVPIGFIALSPLIRAPGYTNYIHYTHSSTLRTIQEIFQVTPWLGGAANATNLSDLFVPGTNAPLPGFRISDYSIISGTILQMTATGIVTNQPLILESATNLAGWRGVLTNDSPGSSYTAWITNNSLPSMPPQFYRFRQVLP
jgi:hypothetical protein